MNDQEKTSMREMLDKYEQVLVIGWFPASPEKDPLGDVRGVCDEDVLSRGREFLSYIISAIECTQDRACCVEARRAKTP